MNYMNNFEMYNHQDGSYFPLENSQQNYYPTAATVAPSLPSCIVKKENIDYTNYHVSSPSVSSGVMNNYSETEYKMKSNFNEPQIYYPPQAYWPQAPQSSSSAVAAAAATVLPQLHQQYYTKPEYYYNYQNQQFPYKLSSLSPIDYRSSSGSSSSLTWNEQLFHSTQNTSHDPPPADCSNNTEQQTQPVQDNKMNFNYYLQSMPTRNTTTTNQYPQSSTTTIWQPQISPTDNQSMNNHSLSLHSSTPDDYYRDYNNTKPSTPFTISQLSETPNSAHSVSPQFYHNNQSVMINFNTTTILPEATTSSVTTTTAPRKKVKSNEYYCSDCCRYFVTQLNLQRHLTTKAHAKIIDNKTSEFSILGGEILSNGQAKCTECNRIFSKKCYLMQHISGFHSVDKRFRCHICGKCFKTQQHLLVHIVKHNDINKPFKCHLCPKQFHYRSDLKRHIDNHAGINLKECPTCGKAFMRQDQLKTHISRHLNPTFM